MKKINRTIVVALFAITLLGSDAASQSRRNTFSSQSQKVERLSSLTQSVAGRSARGYDITATAKERFVLMKGLAESDPAKVIQNALPSDVLSRMPESARGYFESYEKLSGTLEVIAECEEHRGRIERFLVSGDQRFQLFLDSEPSSDLKTGAKISVDGIRLGDAFVASSDAMEPTAPEANAVESNVLSGTIGEKRVLVILVNFQDRQTQPFTVDQARDVTFNTTSNYFREISYGQTWLTGDVYGWYTIPVSSTSCDLAAIASYAQQAATNAGAVLSAYDHQVYAFPQNTGCSWTGSGSLGANPGQVWINNYYNVNSVGHELGHNFGLYHSQSLDCGSQSIGGTCSTSEYGDLFDIMGGGASAHINAFQKERLGWINYGVSPPLQTVTSSGTYWIDAYEPNGASPKGLKILKSTDPVTGKKTWYYIERRTPFGFDSYLANMQNMMSGVVIHTGSEADGREGYLLDMTPATASWYDPALAAGLSFTDPTTGIMITTLSADSTGASVRVDMPTQACVRANPVVSVSPGQSYWVSSGTVYEYAVTVTSNNSGGCGTESYDLAATAPTGWGANYSAPSLALANGVSASSTLYVVSPVGTADGVYNFNVSAVNSASQGHMGSATGSYVIVSRLVVTATPGNVKYSRTQTASVTANVSAAGSPQAGATVTFTMTKPGGAVVTQTVTSAANGNAVFSYRFDRRRDPTGTYTVSVAAGIKGYSGQAATSFLVNK